ncbi:MAG: hypothetical protein DWG78_02210 [Chloroflexi bacterium]|nr:hypothetical protein [Chloroflexota bacterium]
MGLACAAVLLAAGCRNDTGIGGNGSGATLTPTAMPEASVTPNNTGGDPTAATPTPTPDQTDELRDLMLSSLTSAATSAEMERALEELDVSSFPLEGTDRDLWFAVSTGSGVYELPEAQHVAGIYERRSNGAWVEIARLVLESTPTHASAEAIPVKGPSGFPLWVAVTGGTGAHSGTFELLRFDGIALTTALWWFSPSPDVVTLEDLDGDGLPEVILNADDPYVFCYACGVVAHAEVIYRWENAEPTTVTLEEEPGETTVAFLTARAARLVEADLWREARGIIQEALALEPANEQLQWSARVVTRTADERLAQAGSPPQPVVTNLLAGEYGSIVALMRALPPADVFDPEGPLVAGTVAEGWEGLMGEYLIDYASRALALDPARHEAFVARALGQVLLDPATGWGLALADIDAALAIAPDDAFYQACQTFLLARTGGVRG